jgi:hypothetical protein
LLGFLGAYRGLWHGLACLRLRPGRVLHIRLLPPRLYGLLFLCHSPTHKKDKTAEMVVHVPACVPVPTCRGGGDGNAKPVCPFHRGLLCYVPGYRVHSARFEKALFHSAARTVHTGRHVTPCTACSIGVVATAGKGCTYSTPLDALSRWKPRHARCGLPRPRGAEREGSAFGTRARPCGGWRCCSQQPCRLARCRQQFCPRGARGMPPTRRDPRAWPADPLALRPTLQSSLAAGKHVRTDSPALETTALRATRR